MPKPYTATDFPHDGAALAAIREASITYRQVTISKSEVDEAVSRLKQNRPLTGLKEVTLDNYRKKYRRGQRPPAITVVLDRATGKYVIKDGLHRFIAGDEEGVTQFFAYLLTTSDPVLLDTFRRTVNTFHGLHQSEAERMLHAVALVVDDGMNIETAAEIMDVSPSTVGRNIRVRGIKSRLVALGRTTDVVKEEWLLDRLGSIKSDPVFVAAFDAVADVMSRKMAGTEDISDFITTVNTTSSEAEALALIEQWIDGHRGAAPPPPPPIMRRLSKVVEALEGASSWGRLRITNDEQRAEMLALGERMQDAMSHLERASDEIIEDAAG